MTSKAFADDTIGTIFVLRFLFLSLIKFKGFLVSSPAPINKISTPSSKDTMAISLKSDIATIILTPIMPLVILLALRISFLSALILASFGCRLKSGSSMPISADDITPIPPALATAEDKFDKDMPTPMPP